MYVEKNVHPDFLCLGIYGRTLASVDTIEMDCLLDRNPDKKSQILVYLVVVHWHIKVYFSFSESKESAKIWIIGLVNRNVNVKLALLLF